MSYFGVNIKKIRKLKSLSQAEMADVIDLKRGALGAYEEGRSEPKIETIINFANYISISIDDLLTRELSVNELLNFNTKLTTDERQLRKTFPKIPIITKSIIPEYLKYHDKQTFVDHMPCLEWPIKEDDKAFRFYEIQDLEMSDNKGGYYPEDIILVKKSNLEDFKEEKLGLVVYEDLKFRKIKIENQKLILKATHPAIEDISISIEDVKEIWSLVGTYQKCRSF